MGLTHTQNAPTKNEYASQPPRSMAPLDRLSSLLNGVNVSGNPPPETKEPLVGKQQNLPPSETTTNLDIKSNEICVVCLNDDLGVAMIALPNCSHKFHPKCIATWACMANQQLMSDPKKNISLQAGCPTCRNPIDLGQYPPLAKYNEILKNYRIICSNNTTLLPLTKQVADYFEARPDNITKISGSLKEAAWGKIGYIEELTNAISINQMLVSDTVKAIEDIGEYSDCSDENNEHTTELKALIAQLRAILSDYNDIHPPLLIKSNERQGTYLEHDASKAPVLLKNLHDKPDAIKAALEQFDLSKILKAM